MIFAASGGERKLFLFDSPGPARPRTLQRGETTIINAYERYILEIPDKV